MQPNTVFYTKMHLRICNTEPGKSNRHIYEHIKYIFDVNHPISDIYLTILFTTSPCTIKVEPCQKEEGRRIDGTCTNPKYPSRGGSPTPLLRMRPAKFGLGKILSTTIYYINHKIIRKLVICHNSAHLAIV